MTARSVATPLAIALGLFCWLTPLQAEEYKTYSNKDYGFQVQTKAPMKFTSEKLSGAKLEFFEAQLGKDHGQGVVILSGKKMSNDQAIKLLVQKHSQFSTPVPIESGSYKGLEVEGITGDGVPFILDLFPVQSRYIGAVAMGVDLKENRQFVKSLRLGGPGPSKAKAPKK